MSSKAVFLDKDGTLVQDLPYNVDPDRIQLAAGALEALCLLRDMGYRLIVVTNQSGVARGLFREQELRQVEQRLRAMISTAGVSLTGFYYCPHHPNGKIRKYAVECFCRKPQPGMLYRAALEENLDLRASWLVGDILHDIEAGKRAGCRTVLIDNKNETEWKLTFMRQPNFTVKNLQEAAYVIANASFERDMIYGEQEQRLTKYY